MTRFAKFCSRLNYTSDEAKVHELLECIPPECFSTLSRQHAEGLYELPFAEAIAAAKEVVVPPQPTSVIRSKLHSCRQKEGETFAAF